MSAVIIPQNDNTNSIGSLLGLGNLGSLNNTSQLIHQPQNNIPIDTLVNNEQQMNQYMGQPMNQYMGQPMNSYMGQPMNSYIEQQPMNSHMYQPQNSIESLVSNQYMGQQNNQQVINSPQMSLNPTSPVNTLQNLAALLNKNRIV